MKNLSEEGDPSNMFEKRNKYTIEDPLLEAKANGRHYFAKPLSAKYPVLAKILIDSYACNLYFSLK